MIGSSPFLIPLHRRRPQWGQPVLGGYESSKFSGEGLCSLRAPLMLSFSWTHFLLDPNHPCMLFSFCFLGRVKVSGPMVFFYVCQYASRLTTTRPNVHSAIWLSNERSPLAPKHKRVLMCSRPLPPSSAPSTGPNLTISSVSLRTFALLRGLSCYF